ncbi:hypothetical protein [Coleofasciculus sp. FACHB-542]|uniref:hypothetical protein n=1 Tax=Coleofasciculus sp. FACHB-542 TaxID=2692787 RepID=UPI0016834B47|nr:hypothetical protein [Coleofasciculus sp. FACHB-542]MBD2083458.1 hypothetical protein [Coleofasciculus sp. FACHB-542]
MPDFSKKSGIGTAGDRVNSTKATSNTQQPYFLGKTRSHRCLPRMSKSCDRIRADFTDSEKEAQSTAFQAWCSPTGV